MEAESNCQPNLTTVYTWLLCAINTKIGGEAIAKEALSLCQKYKLNINNIFLYRLVTKETRQEITKVIRSIWFALLYHLFMVFNADSGTNLS